MKVYLGKTIWADASNIKLPAINHNWTEEDAWPFLFCPNSGIMIEPQKGEDPTNITHEEDLRPRAHTKDRVICGRLWTNHKIVSFYRDSVPSSSELEEINFSLTKEDISDYQVIITLLGRINEKYCIAVIPYEEYVQSNYSGQESRGEVMSRCRKQDIIDVDDPSTPPDEPKTSSKIDRFPGDDEYTKLNNMRAWYGYSNVAESKHMKGKKILVTEAQLRVMLSEIASTEINTRAMEVNTNPTEPQKEAGNYKMAHISVKGMQIAIENPKGSKRYYWENGVQKYNVMKHHYGYFNVTKGKDGDAVDVFIGPDIDDFENVYCVDQNNKEGEFDETKVMLGFSSKDEAKEAYFANYSPNWKGFRDITAVSLKTFKKWLYRGRKQRQPFADYVEVQKKQLEEEARIFDKEQNDRFNAFVDKVKQQIVGDGNGFYTNRWGDKCRTIDNPSEEVLQSWVKDIDKGKLRSSDKLGYFWNTNTLNRYFSDIYGSYYSPSFIRKAIDRAMLQLRQKGVRFNYYRPL